MKKALVILLCALAVFAIVSCKNEPKPEPEPAVETFTVTFNTGEDGPAVEPKTVEKGSTVIKPVATKEGSYVKAWYTEAGFENAYDFSTPVTADITLYAKWAEDFAITRLTASKGRNEGWDSYDKFELILTTPVAKDDVISITYRCTRPVDQYNVRTNTNTNGDQRWVYEKDKTALTSYDDSDPDGWVTVTYKFTEYADRVNGDKNVHTMTDELYAGVSDFAFHLRGCFVVGDYLEIKQVLWKGEPVDIAAAAKASLTKSGDVVQKEENVEGIKASTSTWTGDKTYYVYFYADPTQGSGTDYSKDSKLTGLGVAVAENALVAKPEDPVRDGFTFAGWCKDKTYDGSDPSRMWDFDTYTVESDRMLYAIWTPVAAE